MVLLPFPLHLARRNLSYAGGAITRPEGTCSVTASKVGSTWTITTTTSSATDYVRTIKTVSTINGYGVTITSWIET